MQRWPILIIIFVTLISAVGCANLEAISQVMANRAIDSLVQQIGEAEIQRQKVLNAIEEAKKEIVRLQRIEAESTVKAEMLSQKLEKLKERREVLRETLLQIADLVEAGQPITLADGTSLTTEEILNYAERAKSQFEVLNQKIDIYQESIDLLTGSAREAHSRWVEGESIVIELEAQVELLDAQIAALKLFQEQPEVSRVAISQEDAILEAQRIMDETLEKLEEKRRILAKMDEIRSMEDIWAQSSLKSLELDLKYSEDLVSELRSLAGEANE